MAETGSTAQAWAEFVNRWLTRRGMNNNQLADAIGVHRATVGNWRRAEVTAPDHDKVRAVASALRVDVKDAYLAAGILRPGDLDVHTMEPSLEDVDDDDLLDEISMRLSRLPRRPRKSPANAQRTHPQAQSLAEARGKAPGLRQSDVELAARRRAGRKGADPAGLDDDQE